MLNRRTFIQQSGSLALASIIPGRAMANIFDPETSYELGVQLFTLMSVIDQDTEGTLKKVAALGYKNIESAFSMQPGFYGKSAPEFETMLNDMGLKWRSHHVLGAPFKMPPGAKMPTDQNGAPIKLPPMLNLKENMQELIDGVSGGGLEYFVCANIPINTPQEVAEAVEILNRTGEACKKANLQFVYHNHDAEFKQVGDTTPYHAFLTQIPPDLMKMELDLAWAIKGGMDPLVLFEAHPGRFPLWHIKDLSADFETVLPVGQGTIDYRPFFKSAEKAGLKYPFIEHDMPSDGIASLAESIAYLKKNIPNIR